MTKTYRVNQELAELAAEKMIKYITEEQQVITEAQIINACIEKGLEDLTHEELKKFIHNH